MSKFRISAPVFLGIALTLLLLFTLTRFPGPSPTLTAGAGISPAAAAQASGRVADYPLGASASITAHLPLIMQGFDHLTFTHGIASGDVTTSSAVLWTRVAGIGPLNIQVATDPGFSNLVFESPVQVLAASDFTIRWLADNLQPGQTYYYRWQNARHTSQTGTFQTPPLPAAPADVRFAFSGDSDGTLVNDQPAYNQFEALDAARLEGLDFFVYLGDTIYADSGLRTGGPAITLPEYREVYQVNRQIAALRDLLAATSAYVTWDDHEVFNDFDGQTVNPDRYAAGRQAFLEYMPISDPPFPQDPTCAGDPLFRVFHWGSHVDIIMLDERSCRSPDVTDSCMFLGLPDPAPTAPASLRTQFGLPASPPAGCLTAINDPTRTMLGPVQKGLFFDALSSSTATFKFVVNQQAIQQFYALPYDRWEGYATERAEILNYIRDNSLENVIFLTTDLHANLMNEVFIDQDTDNQTIAYEAVTGPIATRTMQQAILAILGQPGLDAFNAALTYVGTDCRHLDTYSYGLVEVDSSAGTATITLKDDSGNVLADQVDNNILCTQTFGP